MLVLLPAQISVDPVILNTEELGFEFTVTASVSVSSALHPVLLLVANTLILVQIIVAL